MLKILSFLVIFAVATSHQWGLLTASQQQSLAQLVTQPERLKTQAELPGQATDRTSLQTVALPVRIPGHSSLVLPVRSAIAIDQVTGTVLYEQAADTQLPIASLTKLATALVTLAHYQPTDIITIPPLPPYQAADARAGLVPGDHFTVQQLIAALLIPSANDAADALAISQSGSITDFAEAQNAKLASWGIAATHLSNASGLTDDNNYSTARDLSKIANLVLESTLIRETIGQSSAAITSQEGRSYQLQTTNQLLSTKEFHGIKTGYTAAAGQCYIGLASINGHEVITVVLGAADRFGNTKTLTDWITSSWQWL